MASLCLRRLLILSLLLISPALFAHDVTLTGTQTFASLDGSASDHDGSANGVFTVSDGNLTVNGVVNCNDDGVGDSACAMAFAVSGNLTINSGGALYAENRSGGGTGGAITMTVGGNLALNGTAIVSTSSKSSSGATGGAITANAGNISVGTGSTIDSGSANARGGNITLAASGLVSVDGNVLSGPSRTLLSTRLGGGAALDGGTSNQIGGSITISSSTFVEPALVVGANANIISQGGDGGAGPVTIDGCGIQVRGLIAALARKDGAAKVSIRSGKDLVVDARDLGTANAPLGRYGRLRADAPTGTALGKGVDLFAAETIDIYGPGGSNYAITSLPGLHDSKSYGGLIRIISLGDAVNASGNVIDDGHTASGDSGGSVEISAKEDVNLNTAVIRAVGDFSTNNPNRGGGSIRVRSYSGDVIWTNGTGEVRPVGSNSNLPLADQGSIVLTACGTVTTTGSSFPVMGTATSVFPETHTGVCSPAAPSLPSGVPALVTCNTPPVANDATASTNEDTTVTITLSGTDADGDSLTFSIVSGPANGSLGPIIPTGPTTATVDYTPNADYNGGDSFVYQANDGNGGTDNATVTITVAPVNDPPTFLAGPTVTVLEDAGAQSYANWATGITAGPANESGQTVTFTVTNDNPSLFSVQPALSSTGTLTFTAAANTSGSANITIVAQDNGGTANGGDDTSNPQTSSITVTPVNDAPSFTKGADQTVNEDAGPQTVAGWATGISAGPNEGSQTVSFVVTNDDNSLFSSQPAVASDGTLTYTPAANAYGTATVTVYAQDDGGTANGGVDSSASQTFTITINSVNDAPSFTSGGDVSVLEDSGAYSAAWATAISAGPANESSQSVSFSVSNSNNSLFSVQPAIDASGVLTFTLAADTFGSATVTVTLSDDGGTANGGVDTSAPQTFTITVGAVNDAPSFTAGGDVTVNEDSGAYWATWATAISAGPNESGQTVSFNVSSTNAALFSAQPSISPAGVLTFTPAPNAFGTSTVTVSLSDNGGTANGGVDTSGSVTFTITVNGVNDPPFAGNDSWQTFGNTELRVDLAGGTTPRVFDATGSGTGVLDNDADNVENDPFAITGIVGCADVVAPFDCAVTGGFVSLNANGTFSFLPSPNATTGSFQYTVTDMPSAGTPASANGTVTISMVEMIWYVNGAAPAGGNGTSSSPYNSLAPLNAVGDPDGTDDYIFVHTSNVAGPIAMEQGQKLWGEGIGLSINVNLNGNGAPVVLVPAGTRPNVTSGPDTVTILGVNSVQVAGLSLSSSAGNAVTATAMPLGSAVGASIYANVITGAALVGIDVNGGSAAGSAVIIDNNVITSTGTGIDVTSAGNTGVSVTNVNVTSTGASGIVMSATGSLAVNNFQNITVSGNTAVDGIRVSNAQFGNINAGTVTVGASGNPVGGEGVVLSNVSGGTLAFGSLTVFGGTTGVTISGAGAGFTVTNAGGSISAPNGVGLSVSNANIGAANLTFTSINAANGTNGINLVGTGNAGGLEVLGTGAAGTGGTLSNNAVGVNVNNSHNIALSWMNLTNANTADGGGAGVCDAATVTGCNGAVKLVTARNVALSNVAISGTIAENGIFGSTVTNLDLTNVSIPNAGNAANEHGIRIADLLGTASAGTDSVFTNVNVTNAASHNIFIIAGTATNAFPGAPDQLTITGSTIHNPGSVSTSDGITIGVRNAANFRTVATGNTFTTARSSIDSMQVDAGNTSHSDFTFTGNSSTGYNTAVNVSGAGTSVTTFNVSNNPTLAVHAGTAINVASNGDADLRGTIANNSVTTPAAWQDGVGPENNGFGVDLVVDLNGSIVATVDGNNVDGTSSGLRGTARNGNGTLNLTMTNNTFAAKGAFAQWAVLLAAGNGSSGEATSLCVNLNNNQATTTGAFYEEYWLEQWTGNAFNLQGLTPAVGATEAQVEAFVSSKDIGGATVEAFGGTEVSYTGGTICTTP